MSLRKSIKRITKKVKTRAKQIGRRAQEVGAKVVKYATPVLAGVGTFIGGPLVGAGVTAAGSAAARGMGATAARRKGLKGKEARTKGRKLMRATAKYGLLGTGAGMVGAGVFAAASGGNILGALTGGTQNIFGLGGGSGGGQGNSFYEATGQDIIAGEGGMPPEALAQAPQAFQNPLTGEYGGGGAGAGPGGNAFLSGLGEVGGSAAGAALTAWTQGGTQGAAPGGEGAEDNPWNNMIGATGAPYSGGDSGELGAAAAESEDMMKPLLVGACALLAVMYLG